VRSFLKICKNCYGEQDRCLALWRHKALTRFEIEHSGDADVEEPSEADRGGFRQPVPQIHAGTGATRVELNVEGNRL
jgi:hypothetical protein